MDRPSRKGKTSMVSGKGPAARASGVRKAPRQAPEEAEESGGGEEEEAPPERASADPTYRLSGISLAIKVTLACVGAVALASLALVVAAFSGAKGEVDDEINQAGSRMVKVLASIDVSVWKEIVERPAARKLGSNLVATASSLSKVIKEIQPSDEKQKKKIDDAAEELNKAFNAALEEINSGSLPNPMQRMGNKEMSEAAKLDNLYPAVLDIIVFSLEGGNRTPFLAIAPYAGRGEVSLAGAHVINKSADGLEIREGTYNAGGRAIPARQFQFPIRNNLGTETGEVWLILAASKIDEVQGRLLGAFLLPAIIAVAVGAGIGFFMASTIVKPVKQLLRDIHAVAQGDLSHKTNAHSGDEIGLLARAFNAMTMSLGAAQKKEVESKALEHELNIATEIQSNLLPKRIPRFPGYDIGAFYRPSKEVGGDYYDFIQIDQENLGIVVADVSGKGIPGSMVMTMARSLLRMEAERNLSTADTLVKTNRILARDIRRGMFVTCMYMVLNVRNRTLLVSSAGHNPLIIARHATKKHELVNPNGIALGFDKGPIFERTIKEQRVQLFPGDRICSYTDGVVESMSPDNEEFGDDRFYDMNVALAARTSNEFITTVVDALDKHQSTGPQHDDITLVTVRLLPS